MNRVASFFTPAKIFWAYGVCLSALVAAGFFQLRLEPFPAHARWCSLCAL